MAKTYRIGSRASPLALSQVDEVVNSLKRFYADFSYEIIGINTYGDKDKVTPISIMEGTDFFTREIDEALLRDEIDPSTALEGHGERSRTIDFAVHSAKDLPDEIPEGLKIAAITKSIDPYDALVSKGNLKIDQLKFGARIGASSLRRKMQLKKYRQDFQVVDIRGNIEERLKKLELNGLDAIIVAAAALMRLGQEFRITQRIPFAILKPHPLQGALAIEARKERKKLIDLLGVLNGK